MFKLISDYRPIESQDEAINKICGNLRMGKKYQVLLGVTGSGKTFITANVIEKLNLPTLIISHNKTLAGQIYQEMREFFPKNSVNYFVSYYDYYQPEAYIPNTDTYIEKDSSVNDLLDKLRLQTTSNILSRKDVVVVSSVSCIYNIGNADNYKKYALPIYLNQEIDRKLLIDRLVDLFYERSEFEFKRGSFRIRGNAIEINLATADEAVSVEIDKNTVQHISLFDPKSGEIINQNLNSVTIFPSKHFIAGEENLDQAIKIIENDLEERVKFFKRNKKLIEAQRIKQKVEYDLEMIKEVGYVKGIENYSRYFDGRNEGDTPYSLLDYFNKAYGDKWLLVVDESHITFSQIRGMFDGDHSRKKTLIDYGFRLPSAFDNRPLNFTEFLNKKNNFLALSATPSNWEIEYSKNTIVEQLVRPTGIIEPEIEIKPLSSQIAQSVETINKYVLQGSRILVTTLTKRTAEDITKHLVDNKIKAAYLHSDIKTLERAKILEGLRNGKYDVLVGINLLREGLDLPEVSMILILDADKEGFLRSYTSLVQTMGRAARNIDGKIIMFADKITNSMTSAIAEIERRRQIQLEYNKKHNISPKSIIKPMRDRLVDDSSDSQNELMESAMTPMEIKKYIKKLNSEMNIAARNLDFESAILIRDKIETLKNGQIN